MYSERLSHEQRDPILDRSDLSGPIDEKDLRSAKLSPREVDNLVPMGTVKRPNKKGYKLLYQVEKVVTVPVGHKSRPSYERVNQTQRQSPRPSPSKQLPLKWDNSTKLPKAQWQTMEGDKKPPQRLKQARSVKPRMKYRAMLPQVLNEPSVEFVDFDSREKLQQPQTVSPMQAMKEKAIFSRKTYQRELAWQKHHRSPPRGKKSPKNKRSQSGEEKINQKTPPKFKNPQQEAMYRQQMLLDQIRNQKPADYETDAGPKQASNGKLYILKERSGQGASPVSQRQLLVHTQPSQSSKVEITETSTSQLPQEDFQQGKLMHSPKGEAPSIESTTHRRQSIATAEDSRHNVQPESPCVLVSQEGGIVNLNVDNEFDNPQNSRAKKVRNRVSNKRGAVKRSVNDYQSYEIMNERQTNTGSLLQRRGPDSKYAKQQHARFLVELMSPFASRAGTQGLTVSEHSSTSRERIQMREKTAGQQHGKLQPINMALLQRSQRNYLPNSLTSHQPKRSQIPSQPGFSVPDDGMSSIDTKRNPFKNYEVTDTDSLYQSQMQIKDKSGDQQTQTGGNSNDIPMTTRSSVPNQDDSILTPASGEGTRRTRKSLMPGFFADNRKLSLNTPSAQPLQQERIPSTKTGEIPYMTANHAHLTKRRKSYIPESLNNRVKHLPKQIQKEIKGTQETQLYEFYEAMLQPSTLPFTQRPDITTVTPKIGDKVSMLGNVRETLTKRYQLAKAAKVEARRRLKMIDQIRALRTFIKQEVNYKPMYGEPDLKQEYLERVAYPEPVLINDNLWSLIQAVYTVEEKARQTAAAYKIQIWIRMTLARNKYKKTHSSIIKIQRLFRFYKLRKFFMHVKIELRKRAVLVLQRVCKGYLVYNQYFSQVKGKMTNKNLDYIIEKHADAKAFMFESLQIRLAYLTRKMIKRKKIEAEERERAALAEKKRIQREKELAKLRKIHEERKTKKRQVRQMLKETVEILYQTEDKRREDAFNKYKKSLLGQAPKKYLSKYDIPFEPVTVAFGQELFDGCLKKIGKRIAAAKKKAKANKDLKSVSKQGSGMNQSIVAKDFSKTGTSGMNKTTSNMSAVSPSRNSGNATPDSKAPVKPPSTYNPILEPHHLQLIQVGKRIKMVKFDKNPNPKLRRNYKDMTAIEVTVECLSKECERLRQAEVISGDGKGERASSKQSTSRQSVKGGKLVPSPSSRNQTKRETPDQVNINIQQTTGGQTPQETPPAAAPLVAMEAGDAFKTSDSRNKDNFGSASRKNSMKVVQKQASICEEVRVQSNDDLSMIESDRTSETSASLSNNSENYDFMNVYMPLIRPKPESEDEEELKVEDTKKPAAKGKAGAKAAPKRKSTAAILGKNKLASPSSSPAGLNFATIKRQNTLDASKSVGKGMSTMANEPFGKDSPLSNQLETIPEPTVKNTQDFADAFFDQNAPLETIREKNDQSPNASQTHIKQASTESFALNPANLDAKLQEVPQTADSLINLEVPAAKIPVRENDNEVDQLQTELKDGDISADTKDPNKQVEKLTNNQAILIESAGTPSTDEPLNKKMVAPHSYAQLPKEASMAAISQATEKTVPAGQMQATESQAALKESEGGPILLNIQSSSLSKVSSSMGDSAQGFIMLPQLESGLDAPNNDE